MIVLGIDPDKGYGAVRYDGRGRRHILEAGTVKGMVELKNVITASNNWTEHDEDLLVRIERPINLKTFPRPGVSPAAMMKIAQNCGVNYRKAAELGEFCEEKGLKYEFVVPSPMKYGKMSAGMFKSLTGWEGRTSSHSRDAIAIAMGFNGKVSGELRLKKGA